MLPDSSPRTSESTHFDEESLSLLSNVEKQSYATLQTCDDDSASTFSEGDFFWERPPSCLMRVWLLYYSALERKPLIVKSITALLLMGLADFGAQMVEHLRQIPYDHWVNVWRMLRFSTFGLMGAPWTHYYYDWLDRTLPPTPQPWTWTTAVKVFIDQFIQAPALLALIISGLAFMELRGMDGIKEDMEKQYMYSLIQNYVLKLQLAGMLSATSYTEANKDNCSMTINEKPEAGRTLEEVAAAVEKSLDDATMDLEEGPKNGVEFAAESEGASGVKQQAKHPRISRKVSALDSSADPFAARDGKTLLWRNVNMVLKGKSAQDPDRKLLDNVWGEVPECETTAIMGPSGAGKTSLLNILAGRAATRGRVQIDSDVRLNNYSVNPTDIEVRQHIAFVAQDDSLQVTSTPREAIHFSAKLRLPRSTPDRDLTKLVDKMLVELGLAHCADTYIGGALLKGISGGERKRTSVGTELVVRPAMVFLDEPTSGLDSFSAVQLCQVLKKVANAGASVLFTIHQPSSEIFSSFDRLLLLNKGRVMYNGSVDAVGDYFGQRGHPLPLKYNPADWVMYVAQSVPIDELDQKGFFIKDTRDLPEAFTGKVEGKDSLGITMTENDLAGKVDHRPVGFVTQLSILFARELRNLQRDTASIGARFGLTIFLGILVGVIFYDVGAADSAQPSNLNSQFGALIMVTMMGMFGTAQPALLAFPEERPVFLREYSTDHYSVAAYFVSRLTMEAVVTALQILIQMLITYFLINFRADFFMLYLVEYALAMSSTALAVMLGCSVEDAKLGQEMMPILFVPQMLFAGFFVTPELIPSWLRWAQYLCSLTYAVRIALVLEFGDGCGSETADYACAGLLENINADEDETWWNWLILLALFVGFRLLALFILQQKALKFF
eukprot:Nitzschia sp. Nitz4//scaffold82_size85912//3498//7449//NITZ4_005123-RA/size85912-processed-gene-0.90-mRNA-1//1//CDS//3329558781//5054//frame0